MAIGYNPSANPAMTRVQGANYQQPNSIIAALQGITPDYNYGMHQSSLGGFGQGGSGGSGGSGGGGMGNVGGGWQIGGGGEQYGTSGQAAKIAGLSGIGQQAVREAGQQGRFNTIVGMLGGGPGAPGSAGFGKLTPINTGPIWNQGQIQQHINQAVGQNDARGASSLQTLKNSASGRGMGGQSPLMMALTGENAMATNALNSQAREGINWDAAQGNAKQVLGAQTAQAQQQASRDTSLASQFKTNTDRLGKWWESLVGTLRG